MNHPSANQRTELVAALWALHRALRRAGSLDATFSHFNAKINDRRYRRSVIETALASQDGRLAELARRADRLDAQLASGGAIEVGDTRAAAPQTGRGQAAGVRRYAMGTALIAVLLALAGGVAGFLVTSGGGAKLGGGSQVVSGSIVGATHWQAHTTYTLEGPVFVEGGAKLLIDPGTRILGKPGAALIVTSDATIEARGTAEQPIVFTSAKPQGTRQRGDWGGVVLLGNAPVNRANARIEGIPADDPRGGFGGSDAGDFCGVLQYVRIEFAGYELSADNELNGLTVGGCGEATVLRYIQVHMGLDDGVEFFGGTANIRHLLVTRPGDDAVDWDMGWRGNAQFVIVQQDPADGDNAFEADNLKADHNAAPRSAPRFANVTLIGSGNPEIVQRAMTLRRGTAGTFRNMIIAGFPREAIDVRDAQTAALAEAGQLDFDGVMLYAIGPGGNRFFEDEQDDDGGFDEGGFFTRLGGKVRIGQNPELPSSVYSLTAPDFVPAARSPAATAGAPLPQGEFWDEAASYLGAIRPGSATTWLDGWTRFPHS